MFILTQSVRLYSTKLVTDLVSRSGPYDGTTVCPKPGCLLSLDRYFKVETCASKRMLYEKQPDFDADKCKPQLNRNDFVDSEFDDFREAVEETATSASYNPAVNDLDFKAYYRRLEDIHEFYLQRYVENLAHSIQTHKSGGSLLDFDAMHRSQYTLASEGDNGIEYIEVAELESRREADIEQVTTEQEAKLYLPYTVKRLWSLSRLSGVHVPTFIQSYIRAKEANDFALRAKQTTSSLKVSDVVKLNVYSCNTEGVVTKKLEVKNKNVNASQMFEWIEGRGSKWTSFYQDYRNLLLYCKVLKIDLKLGNLFEIDREFVNKLVIRVVTPNTQFDSAVADALRTNAVNSRATADAPSMTLRDAIINTINVYEDFYRNHETELNAFEAMSTASRMNIRNASLVIYIQFCMKYGIKYPSDLIKRAQWFRGFLCVDGEPLCVHIAIVDQELVTVGAPFNSLLFSETGYLVAISTYNKVKRINTIDAVEWIKRDKIVEMFLPKWETVGV